MAGNENRRFSSGIRSGPGWWTIGLLGLASALSARAADPKDLSPFRPFLSFREFSRLDRGGRIEYLRAIRETLVDMDRESGDERRASSGSMDGWATFFFDRLVCPAYAGGDPGFCINLGFVKPQEACEKGSSRHNFQTLDLLKTYQLDSLAKCPAGQKPCSPFFGVQADGTLYCNAKNSTPACDRASPRDDSTFLNALNDCAKKSKEKDGKTELGTKTKVTVSCGSVTKFFEEQTRQIAASCARSTRACRYVRERVAGIVRGAADDTKKTLGFVNDAITQALQGGAAVQAPCEPGDEAPPKKMATIHRGGPQRVPTSGNTTAEAKPEPKPEAKPEPKPEPKPEAETPAQAQAKNCNKTDYSFQADPEKAVDAVMSAFGNGDRDACANLALPGQKTLTLKPASSIDPADPNADIAEVQMRFARGGSERVGIPLSPMDVAVIYEAMQALPSQSGIAKKDLLDSTLPANLIHRSQQVNVAGHPFAVTTWSTANGTVIKYTEQAGSGQLPSVMVQPQGKPLQVLQLAAPAPRSPTAAAEKQPKFKSPDR